MAPIYILIGFGFGYLFGKLLEPRNLYPRNWGYKLLLCIGVPSLLYGLIFLIVGVSCNWWMYMVGAKTAAFFMGCVGMLISMLIFVKVKKPESVSDNEPTQTQDESVVSESIASIVPEEPEPEIIQDAEIKQEEEQEAPKEKEDELSPFEEFMAWLNGKKSKKSDEVKEEKQESSLSAEEKKELINKILKVLKKICIGLLIIIVIAGIAVSGYFAHNYYKNTYLPEKHLKEACAELEEKWAEVTNDEQRDMALKILSKNAEWGYESVPDDKIDLIFSEPKRKAAFKIIEDEAFRGNADCQFLLGQLYYHSERYHVATDYTKAAYWWKEAANNGNMAAMNNLGSAYNNEIGVKRNMEKAIECYKIAAAANDEYGLYNMGCMYEYGVKVESGYHYEQYRQRMYKSPKSSNDIFVRSAYIDGDWYEFYKHKVIDYKTIVPKDTRKAREYWEKAAALGHEDARNKLQQVFD